MWFWSVSWSTNCQVYFSSFLVDQNKIFQSKENFGQSLIFLVKLWVFFVYPLITRLNKKIRAWPKIPWDWTIFSLVHQKKGEIDWTIGRPRDWPKPHGRDYCMLKRNFGIPKRNLVDQKYQSLTINSLRLNKKFFGRPKRGRNRLDKWSTKRLTKTTWTGI